MKPFLLFFLLLCSCSSSYIGKEVKGADEFVMDSYKIREGKCSILEMEGKSFGTLTASYLEEYSDAISNDDVLYVALSHPSRNDLIENLGRISREIGFRVNGGQIYLPELSPVKVLGLTLKEAADIIQKSYAKEIANIEVYVSYKERMTKKVELTGMVGMATIPVDGKIRLFEVLSKARIPPNANLFKSYVLRENSLLPVDIHRLIKDGDMSQNIVMRGGDKIYIAEPSAATLMVMGEVREEKVIDLPSGFISLREAIALAHGIPFSGDKSYIQVIRGNIVKPKIYLLNWEHVINLPNSSLLLMPGDIVYVASKPITEWNRFISQLLPSFTGLEVVKRGISGVGVIVP
jgi:polysaccharide biosynthesis/export protein